MGVEEEDLGVVVKMDLLICGWEGFSLMGRGEGRQGGGRDVSAWDEAHNGVEAGD